MPLSGSLASTARSLRSLSWLSESGLFAAGTALAGLLVGVALVFVVYLWGAGTLLIIASAALLSARLVLRSDTIMLVLLFCFVAAACPLLALQGYMEVARWGVLATATYYLGIRGLARGRLLGFRAEHAPLLFFCVWALATTLYSPMPQLTFLKATAFSVLMALCLLYAEGFSRGPQEATESFFRNLVLIDAALIPFSLGLRWTGREVYPFEAYVSDPEAMYGAFGNPNSLGLFTAFLLPILFWTMNHNPRWRTPLALLTLANLYCLFASRSRASYGAAVVALSLYLLLVRPKLALIGIVGASMLGTLLVAYAPETVEGLSGTYIYKSHEPILESRLDRWKQSWAYIRENWRVGYGLGVAPGVPQEWGFSFTSWKVLRVRGSSLLATWEETGLPGFLLIGLYPFWLGGRAIRYLINSRRSKDPTFLRILALTAATLVGIVDMMLEEWLLAPGFFATAFFWILVFILSRELASIPRRGERAILHSCSPHARVVR